MPSGQETDQAYSTVSGVHVGQLGTGPTVYSLSEHAITCTFSAMVQNWCHILQYKAYKQLKKQSIKNKRQKKTEISQTTGSQCISR